MGLAGAGCLPPGGVPSCLPGCCAASYHAHARPANLLTRPLLPVLHSEQDRYGVLLSEKQAIEAKLDPDAVDQQVGG